MRYNEVKGHWPLMKPKQGLETSIENRDSDRGSNSETSGETPGKEKNFVETVHPVVREISE